MSPGQPVHQPWGRVSSRAQSPRAGGLVSSGPPLTLHHHSPMSPGKAFPHRQARKRACPPSLGRTPPTGRWGEGKEGDGATSLPLETRGSPGRNYQEVWGTWMRPHPSPYLAEPLPQSRVGTPGSTCSDGDFCWPKDAQTRAGGQGHCPQSSRPPATRMIWASGTCRWAGSLTLQSPRTYSCFLTCHSLPSPHPINRLPFALPCPPARAQSASWTA